MTERAAWAAVVVAATAGLAYGGEPSRVEAVIVYRDQAAVTRVVPVPAGAGPMEIVVPGLPDEVVPESLFGDAGEGVQIRAVRYRERALGEEPRQEVRELDQQIQAIEAALRQNQQSQDLAKKKQGFLDTLGSLSTTAAKEDLKTGLLKSDELSKLTRFVFDQHDQLAEKLLALLEEERKLTAQLDLLRRRRDALAQGTSHTEREAVLFVDKQQPEATAIRLGYLVQGVEWTPSYNIRAKAGSPEVELEYNASITQMSGEDWPDSRLTLSTATPTLSADPPALAPFRVALDSAPETGAAHDVVRVARERQAAEERFRAAQTDEARQQAQAAANTAAARLNILYFRGGPRLGEIMPLEPRERARAAVAVDYPLEGRHSLPSRRDVQTVRIAAVRLKATFYLLAQPPLTRYVYRQADLTNSSDTVLLAGKVDAYLDGRFAGTGTLPLVRPGQRFTAGFGVDTRLNATQKLLDRQEEVMGGNKELTLAYQILLENFSDQPLAVRVLDRIPVPMEGRIYVSLLDAEPEPSKDPLFQREHRPHNVLRWDVEVPGEATEAKAMAITYRFKVGFAKDLQVSAGRTITPLFALLKPIEPWTVAEAWSKDPTKLTFEAGAPGEPERIAVAITRGRDGKNAIGRRVDGDLTGYRWLVVELDNQMRSGTRVALGLSAGKGWKYFESTPVYVRPGVNPSVVFDLTAPNYKTEEARWEYRCRPERLDDVRSIYLVFYPSSTGTVAVRDLKLAK